MLKFGIQALIELKLVKGTLNSLGEGLFSGEFKIPTNNKKLL